MILAAIFGTALALAPAPDTSAYDEAVAAWEREDWAQAADAFGRAFEVDPRPEFLWSRAQALRFGGDCEAAIEVYERFIAMQPPEVDQNSARGHIERCEAEVFANEPKIEDDPPPARVDPESTDDRPPPPPPKPRRWYTDPYGIGLLMGGLAASVVGSALVGSAHAIEGNASGAPSEHTYRFEIERAQRRNVIGIACLGVGGALLVGSAIRFIIVGRRAKRPVATAMGFGVRF